MRALAVGSRVEIPEDASFPAMQRPQYKNISLAHLQSLRWSLYGGAVAPNEAGMWVEAALRFCELNVWRLDRRMRGKWGAAAAPATVATAALLLEGHLVYSDPRLLNTVLKIRKSRLFRSVRRTHATEGIAALAAAVADVSDECVQRYSQP